MTSGSYLPGGTDAEDTSPRPLTHASSGSSGSGET